VSGRLFVVATPIGNLEDITLRALRVLREADCVLAEDTRRTRTLLSHHGIGTRLTALHAHSSEARVEQLAAELAAGSRFALVTDAGTPLVSDPGAALVGAALRHDVPVEAIPGASAVITAISVAGLRSDHFRFVGFLPRSGKRRRESIAAIARDTLTSVLFESPQRLPETLEALRDACGSDRRAAVCRELTKLHEQVARGSLAELCTTFAEAPRGEITLVVEGASAAEAPAVLEPEEIDARIDAELGLGRGTKEVAKALAQTLGLDPRETYRRVMARKPPR
jgi:16S rRNA (cytidine1402-2'-O)-methyltransferase